MAKIRSSEFVNFVRNSCNQRYGSLVMKNDEVWSYGVIIARVNRSTKTISCNSHKYSITTSRHQRAVEVGSDMLPEYTVTYHL